MQTESLAAFRAWENFYVIVGSSAAALTGLQFVVMALISDSRHKASLREIEAFGSPTVVHFCAVLMVSAIVSAPWHRLSSAAVPIGAFGLMGVLYTLVVLRRAQKTRRYVPVLEDWIWHVIAPLTSYTSTTIAAFLLSAHAESALFVIGAASLLLLFTGIHNAWDTVTFIVLGEPQTPSDEP